MNPYQNVLQMAANPTPDTSGAPILPTGDNPTLRNLHNIDFQLPLSQAGMRAMSGADAAHEDARIFDTKQKMSDIADKADKSKYKRVKKTDGGFAFYDPAGNEMSAADYATATDKTPTDVLSDSENPVDMQYLDDFNNLQEFLHAARSGDKEALDSYYKANPQGLFNPDGSPVPPIEVLKKFKQAYPTVYGQGGYQGPRSAGQPTGSTLVPNLQALKNNQSYLGGTTDAIPS